MKQLVEIESLNQFKATKNDVRDV